MKTYRVVVSIVLALVAGLFVGIVLGVGSNERIYQRTAVKNGAAYFDPLTGEFTWITRTPVEIRRQVIRETENERTGQDGTASVGPDEG